MSACRDFRDQLSAHLDGALGPRERAALEAHLAECGACREALEGLRRTVARIRALEPVEPPPWLAERILARVGRPPRARRLLLLAARPQLQAAALVLICFTGFLVLKVAGPRRTVPPPVLEPTLPLPEATPPDAVQEAPAEAKPRPRPAQKAEKAAPPRSSPPVQEPPPAAPGAAPSPYRVQEYGAAQDSAKAGVSARKTAAGSIAEVFANPDVTFRLEPDGDPTEAVRKAVLQSRGVLTPINGARVGASLDAEDLPTLRAALKKLGRLEETRLSDRSGIILVKISW